MPLNMTVNFGGIQNQTTPEKTVSDNANFTNHPAFSRKSLAKSFTGYHTLSGSPTLPRDRYAPLALSRFLRRAGNGACKNRSAAPNTAPCFVRRTRSLCLPARSLRLRLWRGTMHRFMGPDSSGTALTAAVLTKSCRRSGFGRFIAL